MALSIVGFVSWLVWWYYNFVTNIYVNLWLHNLFYDYILPITVPLLVFSILLTALFLHLDKLPKCCCDPREQLSVYDPDLDERFIMLDGEVVEDPEDCVDDVETGTKTWCGWCCQTEEQETEHVSAEHLDGSDKVPLTALEVDTKEDDAETTEMT